MVIIKDYGFATFLCYSNYEYKVNSSKEISFKINEDEKKKLLNEYRKSVFYEYDLIGRMLKKELKKQ